MSKCHLTTNIKDVSLLWHQHGFKGGFGQNGRNAVSYVGSLNLITRKKKKDINLISINI